MGGIVSMQDASRLHNVITNTLSEMAHPTLTREDIQGNVIALLVRLLEAGFEIVPVQKTDAPERDE